MTDYYETLNLSPDASEEMIERQYQSLMETIHPDGIRGIDTDEHFVRAKAEIRLLNEAYKVLGDSGSRQEYDRARNLAIETAREASRLVLEEFSPLRRRSQENDPSRPSTTSLRRWNDPFDARVVAAFIAGVLIAGVMIAVKHWHSGTQIDRSFVVRFFSHAQQPKTEKELAIERPFDKPPTASGAATPVPVVARGSSNRIADKGAAYAKLQQRQGERDATDGQIGTDRKERPVSAEIVMAKGQEKFGSRDVGNVEVIYPDGSQDGWTTKGNCGQVHVAADGTVGWTVYQATGTGNYDFQPNGTLVLRKRGRIIQKISSAFDHIDAWNFIDRGSKVIVRARRSSGATVIERYESATGRMLDSVDAYRADLPSWALSLADR